MKEGSTLLLYPRFEAGESTIVVWCGNARREEKGVF